jgi:hypothetical protein
VALAWPAAGHRHASAVLHRLAGRDVVPTDAARAGPVEDRIRGELAHARAAIARWVADYNHRRTIPSIPVPKPPRHIRPDGGDAILSTRANLGAS